MIQPSTEPDDFLRWWRVRFPGSYPPTSISAISVADACDLLYWWKIECIDQQCFAVARRHL
jgi:hypothetical protein